MLDRFGLLDTDAMPIFMIIAVDIFITLRFSINCSAVICHPPYYFLSWEKPLVKPLAPGSLFHHISSLFHHTSFRSTILQYFTFWSINQKYQKYLLYRLSISIRSHLLQVSVKGLKTPLSHWVQVVDCLCRYLVTCALSPTGLIPWFSNRGKYLLYFAASPFPLQGKNQRKLKR